MLIGWGAGALIGSSVPIIGTIIGAGVGYASYYFQTHYPDEYNDIKAGFNSFVTETVPDAWNEFWSFS